MYKVCQIILPVLILSVNTMGGTWTVDDDGPADFSSIQAAIADVGTINGDEIVVQPGVYIEAIDFLGKAVIWHWMAMGPG